MAQRVFDEANNLFLQDSDGASVRNDTFEFLAGNDRLLLVRNDDLAGLANGSADMGDGRDFVLTSFNMSGTFALGNGDDFFLCAGDISFNGSATDILVRGGSGNDIIGVSTDFCLFFGETGNDIFISDGNRNRFDGGDGQDTYSAEAAEERARIDLQAGTAFVRFTEPETLVSIENVRGTEFDDEINGNDLPNRLDGLAGADSIDGEGGDDTIAGGAGTNFLEGNSGTDTLVVEGTITSRSRSNGGFVVINGSFNGEPFQHRASGFEQVLENGRLKSLAFFLGETPTNTVQRSVIADTTVRAALDGIIRGQTLTGDANANTIDGSGGFDDIAGLGGNDILRGRAGDDFLSGGTGNDRLNGGSGQDHLQGGAGRDQLTGGTGRDVFQFLTPLGGSNDTVTDYSVASDSIELPASLLGLTAAGALPAARFKNTALAAVDANDRILFDANTGKLSFDTNGSGAGGVALIATFNPGLAITASEIQLVV